MAEGSRIKAAEGGDKPPNTRARKPSPEQGKAKPPPKRRDALQGVEDKLNELFATIALGQQGIGIASGDQRMMMSGHVTAELSPAMVHAWVELGRENEAVKRALMKMAEGGAIGAVLISTTGFVYSQAQVWGYVPQALPNPWIGTPVPPSDDVMRHAADNGEPPFHGRTPEDARSGVDDSTSAAHAAAEAQRAAVEERRRQQGS